MLLRLALHFAIIELWQTATEETEMEIVITAAMEAHAKGDVIELASRAYTLREQKSYGPTQTIVADGWHLVTGVKAGTKGTMGGRRASFYLRPATEQEVATRPGRIGLGSDPAREIGRCIAVGPEWLHVSKIGHVTVNAAGISGRAYVGLGRFVSATEADRLNASWSKKQAKALAELTAKVDFAMRSEGYCQRLSA